MKAEITIKIDREEIDKALVDYLSRNGYDIKGPIEFIQKPGVIGAKFQVEPINDDRDEDDYPSFDDDYCYGDCGNRDCCNDTNETSGKFEGNTLSEAVEKACNLLGVHKDLLVYDIVSDTCTESGRKIIILPKDIKERENCGEEN